jgi:hypothetical protein
VVGKVEIESCAFAACWADGERNGGAVYTEVAWLTVSHSCVANCEGNYGGAFCFWTHEVEHQSCLFDTVTMGVCVAKADGGGAYFNWAARAQMSFVNFTHCRGWESELLQDWEFGGASAFMLREFTPFISRVIVDGCVSKGLRAAIKQYIDWCDHAGHNAIGESWVNESMFLNIRGDFVSWVEHGVVAFKSCVFSGCEYYFEDPDDVQNGQVLCEDCRFPDITDLPGTRRIGARSCWESPR